MTLKQNCFVSGSIVVLFYCLTGVNPARSQIIPDSTTNTFSGRGGNINLEVAEILSLNAHSIIKTDALGMGNGGNIEIDATFAIASENSIISAQTMSGQGGKIDILAKDLFITPDSLITASATAELGIDGEVEIQTFNTTSRNSLVKLSETTIKAEDEIVSVCGGKNYKQGEFSYTGKGGLPSTPLTEIVSAIAIY